MAKSIRITGVTICHPHLYEKHAPPGTTTEKYGAEFLVDPVKNAQVCEAVETAFREVAIEAGKGDSLQYLKSPLKDGNQLNAEALAKGRKARPELEGMKVIRANDKTYQPAVVNSALQPIPETKKDQVFGGCIVNAFIDVYWSPNLTNPGVYCGLRGVQLVDNVNVKPLGGGAMDPAQMFEPVEGAPAPQQPMEEKGPMPSGF